MSFRKYLTGVLVVALLIWGPIYSGPAASFIRIGYLIAVPVAAWFFLGWIWRIWQPDAASETRLECALGGATAAVFLVMAILAARANSHLDNTMWIQTRDGMEAVGHDIVLPGPNWLNVIMLIGAAGFSVWFSVIAKSEPK